MDVVNWDKDDIKDKRRASRQNVRPPIDDDQVFCSSDGAPRLATVDSD